MNKTLRLMPADFEKILGEKLSPYVKKQIKKYAMKYAPVSEKERDECVMKIIGTLLDKWLEYSGAHRKNQWEKGWGENFKELSSRSSVKSVIPRYYDKYKYIRVCQEFIRPVSKDFEYNMVGTVLDWIFDAYMRNAKTIYEFGCGTGHNLLRLRQVNPNAVLWGLDWVASSQRIIKKLARDRGDRKLFSRKFDYFHPDHGFKLALDSIVCTVGSLEQVGQKYDKFINYLLKNSPKLCVNIEPLSELLDENNLLDFLALRYYEKRKYLNGFLTCLKKLEKQGKIKIHRIMRTYVGSFYNEGYSLVIWSPVKRGKNK